MLTGADSLARRSSRYDAISRDERLARRLGLSLNPVKIVDTGDESAA
jgi:hypothetical protein